MALPWRGRALPRVGVKGCRGGLGRAGEQRCAAEGSAVLVPGLWRFTALPALPCLAQVCVSVVLKPHVMSCVWSQPDLRLHWGVSCLL